MPSALRLVPHCECLPIPIPSLKWHDTNTSDFSNSDDTQTVKNVHPYVNNCYSTYSCNISGELHLIH